MRKSLFILALGFLCCGISYAAEIAANEFSADMISHSGKNTVQAKIYVAGDKTRIEMPGSIMITRLDKKLTWIVMSVQRMYMEQAIDLKAVPKTAEKLIGEIERVSLGMETVDGKSAEKFKVTYKEGPANVTVYQWLGASKIPVKIEDAGGAWSIEYKNLSVEPQPANLFEIPEGFKKFSMPFGK